MINVNIKIGLYSLNELSENARNRAIEEHRQFLLDMMIPEDFISGDPDYDTQEQLSAAYDAEYLYILENDEYVIESIDINDYMFFSSGELANVTHYTAGEHAGETWLTYNREKIRIA